MTTQMCQNLELCLETKQIINILLDISTGLIGYPKSEAIIECIITYIIVSGTALSMWHTTNEKMALSQRLETSGIPQWLTQGINEDPILQDYVR